jgi:anthranilate/para-aminobenzoate synthase component I
VLTEVQAELIGPGWGTWRGHWSGDRLLTHQSDGWLLTEGGRKIGFWDHLRAALEDLWPRRRAEGTSPWAVGWIGYEESANLAGEFPTQNGIDFAPASKFLLEPVRGHMADVVQAPEDCRFGVPCWSLDASAYRAGVESIRDRIADGEVYQVNLCRRLTVEGTEYLLDRFAAAASRGGEPEYLARFAFPGGEVLCASMEMLLRRRGERLETAPIKGTRPRAENSQEDLRLAMELASDPKERAELAMVIDLERNDLGRVAQVGSVEVIDPGTVRSYASVHHLVGRVQARARPGLEWWELLAAVVPGGSVTGCPKYAAMTVIRELEPVQRGPFTGALGVIAGNGDLEIALPIRTAWRVGSTLEFAAGCGIVWESDAKREEEESRLKVARWLDLVGCGR